MKSINILFSFLFFAHHVFAAKIVGMVQVRNERIFIEQCLRALSLYTDAIVILDDASTDETLAIIKSLAETCNIEKIIEHTEWKDWNEPHNKNELLNAARSIGGTHMVIIDADEMFSADCLTDDWLRKKILALQPGDSMGCLWINLWRSIDQYRDDGSVWVPRDIHRVFCDNGTAYYPNVFLHATSIPTGLQGTFYPNDDASRGILHFAFVNRENLLIKQAWYRCLERLHDQKAHIPGINLTYRCTKDETDIKFKKAPARWFAYPFFNPSLCEQPEQWRKKQVKAWFKLYGKKLFKNLEIWDINWDT